LRSSPSPKKTPADPTSNFKVYKELERIELSNSKSPQRMNTEENYNSSGI
jgi:hypothetical protein